jgi:hemolysin activation/secretion protein/AraC-like DNA-binding protein
MLQELSLRPCGEWTPGSGWTVARVAEGAGYCLQTGAARELNVGDMAIVGPSAGAAFRASQLGVLKLEYYQVLPQCLNGLLTVTEWRLLEDPASNVSTQCLHFAANEPMAQRFTRLVAQSQRDGLASRSALLQLWAANTANLLPASETTPPGCHLRERFRQFLSKLSEAELAVRSLTELAGELHCSERHFSRLFREEFQISLRARQTELRLQRARQLLAESDAKIINVAYESGYRHLGLFNALFKRRFGVTPSQWRRQNGPTEAGPCKRSGLMAFMVLLVAQLFLAAGAFAQAASRENVPPTAKSEPPAADRPGANSGAVGQARDAKAETTARATNAVAHFKVVKYLVSGNTLLTPEQIDKVLTNHPAAFGANVTFDDIRAALADLQMAYRERGFVTVSVGLPQQRLTNAMVKIQVTEGRLAGIKIQGNQWFSTPNVLRALPSLHSNMLLNSHVFQRELDQANASRDRQLYPVIGAGPDPGTTELTLTVKDRFPLHLRGEYNDVSTPGTPYTRAVFSGQYDNLWQLEHQVGLSYTFAPLDYHGRGDYYWWPLDLPLIANYSVYYRIPLGAPVSVQQQIDESNGHFGYNEVTHQFQMPAPSGRPDLTVYASRSVTDSGVNLNNYSNVIQTPLLTIQKFDSGQNVTLNENIGAKLSWPLPALGKLASTFSLGLDFKHYQQVSYNSNNFSATTYITNTDGSVSQINNLISSGQPVLRTEVYYLPLNVGLSGSLPDPWGTSFFNAQANFNLATFGGSATQIQSGTNLSYAAGGLAKVANNTNVHDAYVTVQLGADRMQRIYKDWTVKLHADGQVANGPLFSNEQYGMGGVAGVRGYQDGKAYGDAGWRVSVEPQTPQVQIGAVDGDTPLWLRASVFVDYGQAILLGNGFYSEVAYLNGPSVGRIPGDPSVLDFWGAGCSLTVNVGNHLDGRFTMAFPLDNPGEEKGWSSLHNVRFYFALGAQF